LSVDIAEIPLVDLGAQYRSIRPQIDAAISRVIESSSFILGREVAEFESAFARYLGARGVVGVASGTAALHLALLASGVVHGSEVVTTAHTFTATAEAIVHVGARPVFADIDPVTFNIDPQQVERRITPRTRAVVAVHLYGQPADLGALADICERRGLILIEDAAQAHGAEYRGHRCGTLGHLATFSFYPAKNLGAYGDAGAVVGNDEDLLRRVRKLADHGRSSKYEHDVIGFGERLDSLQAAILGAKLPFLDRWTEARRQHARLYDDLLADAAVRTPLTVPEARHVYHLYVIRSKRRDELRTFLGEQGIATGIHYPVPLHRQPAYREFVDPDLSLPETEQAAAEILSLPMYPELGREQIVYIVERIRESFG
jgi:dTDP-4-amino-4,6-dideoxygalactose transaminase